MGTMSDAGTPRDVVFTFHTETWDDAQRRGMARPPDRLLETLMTTERVRRLLVANPFRSAPARALRWLAGSRQAPFPSTDRCASVTPLRLARQLPTRLQPLERVCRRYEQRLHAAAQRMRLDAPAVITVHPHVAAFCSFSWASSVTYYARDDWADHPAMAPWAHLNASVTDLVRERRVRICAVSHELLERIGPTGRSAIVPNGILAEEWMNPLRPPTWFTELPRPRLLYTGTLDQRLDTTAVEHVARAFPHGSVVLLGPIGDPAAIASLRSEKNIYVQVASDRAELTAVVHAADVGLLPHRRTSLTEAMSPLKLYEYLAAGLPVVATALQPIVRSQLTPQVLLVQDSADFPAAIQQALARGHVSDHQRHAFIEANRWEQRHETILNVALS
jgi:teichuronic acid biosynthesis glycosyltransferase TuaH